MSHIPLEPFLALNNLEPSSAFATPPPEPIARPTALEATARCTNHCFHDYGSERLRFGALPPMMGRTEHTVQCWLPYRQLCQDLNPLVPVERCSGSDTALRQQFACAPHGKKETKDDVQDPGFTIKTHLP